MTDSVPNGSQRGRGITQIDSPEPVQLTNYPLRRRDHEQLRGSLIARMFKCH